jgi:hypothetical protein
LPKCVYVKLEQIFLRPVSPPASRNSFRSHAPVQFQPRPQLFMSTISATASVAIARVKYRETMTTQTSGYRGRSGTNRARVRILSNFGLGGVAALIILGAVWRPFAGDKNGEEVAPPSLAATIGGRSHPSGYLRWEYWRADLRTLAAMVRYLLEPDFPPMEVSAPRNGRPVPGMEANSESHLPAANTACDFYQPAHCQWPPGAQ